MSFTIGLEEVRAELHEWWGIDITDQNNRVIMTVLRKNEIYLSNFANVLRANRGLSRQDLKRKIEGAAFGGGSIALPPAFGMILGHAVARDGAVSVIRPVHGPFDENVYSDPNFVANYTKARYWSRVAEVKSILAQLGKCVVVAIGDGAGVAYRAGRELREAGHEITVLSSDSSSEMCAVAAKLGNVVAHSEAALEVAKHYDEDVIFFLSHVTDYLEECLIERLSFVKTLIYGRAVAFKGCHVYTPYRKKWGYQICSSNLSLAGIVPSICMKEVVEVDYVVFSAPATRLSGEIEIDNDMEEYEAAATEMGLSVVLDADVVVTLDIQSKRKTVAVPTVGILDGEYGSHMFLVAPQSLYGFVAFHQMPVQFAPPFITRKFFFRGTDVYTDDGTRHVRREGRRVSGEVFYEIPRVEAGRKSSVELLGCECFGKAPHCHIMSLKPKNRVGWLNLLYYTRRTCNGSSSRVDLLKSYCSLCGGRGERILARFEHMERVAQVLYDTGGNAID